MNPLLLNCDLGEWEAPEHTSVLMPYLDLANIACGGHAGTHESIKRCLQLCTRHSVKPGLHPGLKDNKGRSKTLPTLKEFKDLLKNQYETFIRISEYTDSTPHHIKLHGSLYHFSETSEELRHHYLNFIEETELKIICLANGTVFQEARSPVLEEVFLDRAYQADGSLMPRSHAKAIISDSELIAHRIESLAKGAGLQTATGEILPISPQTLCVHSDSPDSLKLVQTAQQSILAFKL